MRDYRRKSDQKYLILVLLTLVVVGGALIASILGSSALLTSLPCLLGGAGLILVPWFLLSALERWRDRLERPDYNPPWDENSVD
jgi:preprotein translocase subunit SecY